MKIEDLATKHPYYCETQNYYTNEFPLYYENTREFIKDRINDDINLNLIFRWDINKKCKGNYEAYIFVMLQRKGIFAPCIIKNFTQDQQDVDDFIGLLKRHKERLLESWLPL